MVALGSVVLLTLACNRDEQREVTTQTAPLVPGAVGKATDEASAKEDAYTELDAVPSAGVIKGTVTYTGSKQPAKLNVTKDAQVCTHGGEPDGSLQVADGKLANAVVAITDDIARGKRWQGGKAVVNNTECRFEPRVQIGRYQGEVETKNSDPVFHNANLARVDSSNNNSGSSEMIANVALPLQGQSQTKNLKKSGIVAVKCNVHEWMQAWIYVSKHPYAAVTQADGTYEIAGVPPGEYNAMIWHEQLGQVSTKVKVEPGGAAKLDHAFN
jgi:polysaccharide lyase family 4-like protein